MDEDVVLLDMFICGICKNQFWLESYEIDGLNDPACCPICTANFDGVTEADEER